MEKKELYISCIKCGELGIETPTEVLPDRGTLVKVFHDNGKICEFVKYLSMSTFLDRKKRKRDPKSMECPICGIIGLISQYRPNKNKQYHHWKYIIIHERLDGYWGKKQKVQRYRRCYMKTEEQKKLVLEILGHFA
jgi:hypothetical protein